MDRLDPKLDLVFKLLLTREPPLLVDMLGGILARSVQELSILNPGIPGELASDKRIILDLRASLDDGSRVDLEMQIRSTPDLAARLVYYTARDYADQLRRGEEYHLLTPTAGIIWLVEPLFPALERLHSIFELRERHTHTRFSDHLAIHLLQLSQLRRSNAADNDATITRWARFLTAKSDAEFERLASEHPIMTLAKQTLEQLSQDPETRRQARDREDSIKLYAMSLAASEARGEAKGAAKVLLKQLGLRFGRLPEGIRAQVEAATVAQLDRWTERVLTAKTLDEMFAP